MTTYESGKAPADAPVTWRRHEDSRSIYVVTLGRDAADEPSEIDVYDEGYADAICQWAHLAKLAGEAEPYMDRLAGHRDPFPADWLRRFRAAKGDA